MKKLSFAVGTLWILLFTAPCVSLFLITRDKSAPGEVLKEDRFNIKEIVRYFPFSKKNSLKEWEEKVLKGRVVYLIESDQAVSYVRAKSQKAASALYYRMRLDMDKNPLISWKWRVDTFPKRSLPERIEDTKEEDFAARVYIIFPARFFTHTKTIEYIWSEAIPEGNFGASGYSKNIKIMVLQKGKASDWRFESRDIFEDYIKLFGEKPKLDIGAIAFMTDADSTETCADAVYDEIRIGYK